MLDSGHTDAELSDLSEPENRYERKMGDLVEVYSRIRSPEGEPLLFEAYYSEAGIARQRQQIYDSFQPITLGGLVVLVALTTPLLWALTRRLDRTRRDRQRLLEAAADASESERRRIARDLHDGVVQDLAGTSFALSATLRDPRTVARHRAAARPDERVVAHQPARACGRCWSRSTRPTSKPTGSPPRCKTWSPRPPRAGVTPTVEVYDVDEASDESIRLVWRVAQEAVRNAIRHSNAEHLTVQVRSIDDVLHLDVSDDGDGFDSDEVMAVARQTTAGPRERSPPRSLPVSEPVWPRPAPSATSVSDRSARRPASGCAASAT